jgi:ABC-type lipoprotein release transport system permease subunit
MRSVLIKGIDPQQQILTLPSAFLQASSGETPAIIGSRMAQNSGIAEGDYVTLQWRDRQGTIDARDIQVVRIFSTSVQSIDNNQIWVPLPDLQEMTRLDGEATIVAVRTNTSQPPLVSGWVFQTQEELLKDIRELVKAKSLGSSIIYTLLIMLAMLAIFDTQVLSIFRRRKEIGTLMALGMTRGKVVQLFTLEGALHGVLAAVVATLYGIPLLTYLSREGWHLPSNTDSYGFAIGETLFPVYGAGLVVGTTFLVLVVTTVVSYLPTRRISHLKPTDALRGRTA